MSVTVEDVLVTRRPLPTFGNVFLLASSSDDPGLTKGVAAFCTEQEGRIIGTACILWMMRKISPPTDGFLPFLVV